jgi:hypothetical protein
MEDTWTETGTESDANEAFLMAVFGHLTWLVALTLPVNASALERPKVQDIASIPMLCRFLESNIIDSYQGAIFIRTEAARVTVQRRGRE